ncbi:uncharacterized protein LOC141562220 [Sminthopsis crassicaudata]|uniref:uncharacterized protein LOC141562220 n=1 Tax=Sminthopsis crassicaudata TaxID=9301 RepID=UPI003D69855E
MGSRRTLGVRTDNRAFGACNTHGSKHCRGLRAHVAAAASERGREEGDTSPKKGTSGGERSFNQPPTKGNKPQSCEPVLPQDVVAPGPPAASGLGLRFPCAALAAARKRSETAGLSGAHSVAAMLQPVRQNASGREAGEWESEERAGGGVGGGPPGPALQLQKASATHGSAFSLPPPLHSALGGRAQSARTWAPARGGENKTVSWGLGPSLLRPRGLRLSLSYSSSATATAATTAALGASGGLPVPGERLPGPCAAAPGAELQIYRRQKRRPNFLTASPVSPFAAWRGAVAPEVRQRQVEALTIGLCSTQPMGNQGRDLLFSRGNKRLCFYTSSSGKKAIWCPSCSKRLSILIPNLAWILKKIHDERIPFFLGRGGSREQSCFFSNRLSTKQCISFNQPN